MSSPHRIRPGGMGINTVNSEQLQAAPTHGCSSSRRKVRAKYSKTVITVAMYSPHISLHARNPPASEMYEHDTLIYLIEKSRYNLKCKRAAPVFKSIQKQGNIRLDRLFCRIIYPMRAASDGVPYEQQILWMIDERLACHGYLASDLPLHTANTLGNVPRSRPDLVLFDRAPRFAEDEAELNSLVIVNLKKPDRTGLSLDQGKQGSSSRIAADWKSRCSRKRSGLCVCHLRHQA
jgi:hypothetical protein